MKKQSYFNLLLALTSLNVLLVTVERFSFTTQILLAPYNFLRLHEVFQMLILILFTVLIPALLLREVTDNFRLMQTKRGLVYFLLFVTGVYLYATGNGVHELASFAFNTYCDTESVEGNLCGGLFFNDFYFGNGLYFVGAFFMNLALLLFEYLQPVVKLTKRGMRFFIVNALVYSFAIFAYSAFDRVLVGLIYSIIMTFVIDMFLYLHKRPWRETPVTFYLALCYTIGTVASIIVRFLKVIYSF